MENARTADMDPAADATLQGGTPDGAAQDAVGATSQQGTTTDSAPQGAPEETKSRSDLEKAAMDAILSQEETGKRESFAVPEPEKAAKESKADKPKDGASPDSKTGGQGEKKAPEELEFKRIKDAQRALHSSRAEVVKLQERLKELEGKLSGHSGAKGDAADILENLDLPADTKASLKEMPELTHLAAAIVKSTGAGAVKEQKAEVEKAIAEASQREKSMEQELTKEWQDGIKSVYPDFQEILSSPEFTDWKAQHPGTVKALLAKCDDYDPAGAISVIRAFKGGADTRRDLDQSRAQGRDAASRPGRANRATLPPGDAEPKKKSIRELEAESMAAILREERAKRRSF